MKTMQNMMFPNLNLLSKKQQYKAIVSSSCKQYKEIPVETVP